MAKEKKVKKNEDSTEEISEDTNNKTGETSGDEEITDTAATEEEKNENQEKEVTEVVKNSRKQQKPHIKKRGKKYKEVEKLIDREKHYSLEEAIDLAIKTTTTKFDSAIEVHIKLGIKPEQTDQNIRTVTDMPEGTGKTVRVAAIVSSDKEIEAKEAGAEFVGGDDLITKIEKGFMDFDIVVATPDMMGKVGKLGKILGTKGMMPNPKTETVTDDPKKVIEKLKKGRVELRNDKFGLIHASFGKVSMGQEKILSNFKALYDSLNKAKPTTMKGQLIKGVTLATTMGPSVKVDLSKI